jgi:signal transduction histidine kinase/CheY-like chemotaxis protein
VPAASPGGPLARWFNRTPFRLKFAVVGLLLAGPLLVTAGFGVSVFHARVRALQSVEQALLRADEIRNLAISIALHRGLSAAVLAGGEGFSDRLVAEQRSMLAQLDRLLLTLDAPAFRGIGLPDPAGLKVELLDLARLPEAREPGRNFERHNAVISRLLAVSARLETGHGLPAERATEHDTAFVSMPLLIEEIGRQRGWGSAILQLQQAGEAEAQAFLFYAGAVARRLEQMRADPATLARLDALHGGPGHPVQVALEAVDEFHRLSLAAVTHPARDDEAPRRHFAAGTAAIDHLGAINQTLVAALRQHTADDLRSAMRARGATLSALAVIILLLVFVYREFERSTVDRLRVLGDATRRLSHSLFDERIEVEGADEIAELGQSLDQTRLLLREAIAARAQGLAAQAADQARTEFLARWSHDLRTPLNAMLGFAELIESRPGPALSPAQRSDVQRIRRAGAQLLRLVDDVLDISRIDARQIELRLGAQDVPAAIAAAVELLAPQAAAAGVRVRLHGDAATAAHAPPAGPAVWADRMRLLQILGNLLGNAIKFNRAGGQVELTLRRQGQNLGIEVIDEGPGIAAADLQRLFTPFERLDAGERRIEGSGLGLALSQRLAVLMAGRIDVHSAPGQGACFTLWLPLAPETQTLPTTWGAASPPPGETARSEAPAGIDRIAYVEDDPVNALLVREMLAGVAGISLVVYTTAGEALAAVAQGARFELWLIDKQLPDSDGIALLGRLRETAPLRAVMLSADALPGREALALAAGFEAYWTKPIDLHTLRRGVAQQLAQARSRAGANRAAAGA